MKSPLTVNDPLAEQEVSIIVTLTANEQPRDQRPVMISVGVAKQMPVIKSGTFGEMLTLIDEAWTAFGVRTEAARSEVETVMEEHVVATAPSTDSEQAVTDDVSEPTPLPNPPKPKPAAKNLSLF